jgi:hypothetical protein
MTWKPPPSEKVHGVVQGYKLLYEAASGAASDSQTGRETKISHALSTVLHTLAPYTNYTVQVLAYTKVGEGVASNPVSCTTGETGKSRVDSRSFRESLVIHESFLRPFSAFSRKEIFPFGKRS